MRGLSLSFEASMLIQALETLYPQSTESVPTEVPGKRPQRNVGITSKELLLQNSWLTATAPAVP